MKLGKNSSRATAQAVALTALLTSGDYPPGKTR
jgi:hypothetical protein